MGGDRVQIRLAALCEALRDHRCIVDGMMTVGECVDIRRCGCCNGLLLDMDNMSLAPRMDVNAGEGDEGGEILGEPR